MSCLASDILQVSRHLRDLAALETDHSSRYCEALCRSAISRGYYSLFHAAKDWATDRGFSKPSGFSDNGKWKSPSEHEWIQRWYASDPDTELLATKIKNAFDERVPADYFLGTKTFKPKRVNEILAEIEKGLQLIEDDKVRISKLGNSYKMRSKPWF